MTLNAASPKHLSSNEREEKKRGRGSERYSSATSFSRPFEQTCLDKPDISETDIQRRFRRTTWPLHSIWLFLRMVLTEEELAKANMWAISDNRINSTLLLRGKTNNFVEQASCDQEIQRALFCSPTRSSSAYSFNCSVVHEPWKFSEVKYKFVNVHIIRFI